MPRTPDSIKITISFISLSSSQERSLGLETNSVCGFGTGIIAVTESFKVRLNKYPLSDSNFQLLLLLLHFNPPRLCDDFFLFVIFSNRFAFSPAIFYILPSVASNSFSEHNLG